MFQRTPAVLITVVLLSSAGSAVGKDAKDSGGNRTLAHAVTASNGELQEKYAVFNPTPLTVARVREAIEHAIERTAESELADRFSIVEHLQTIISDGEIPEDVSFQLTPITGRFESGDRMISFNYTLQVPTPRGQSDYRLLGLTQLAEGFRITKLATDEGTSQTSDESE